MAEEKWNQVRDAMLCMTRQCWEQGLMAQTFLELGEDARLDLIVHDMVTRQSSDGRLCNVENTLAVTDSSFCIPSVYIVGQLQKNETYKMAAKRNVDFLLHTAPRAEDGTLFHMDGTREIWADTAAFLPYALALTGHKKEGFAQMQGILKRLYHEESGLYGHIWDEGNQKFLRPHAWGIGNGRILTGLFRLLLIWEETGSEKEWLKSQFYALLERMLFYQTEGGGFHDILDCPDTFEESETAAMTAYILYWAMKEGILDWSYSATADLIRHGLEKKVTGKGLVLDAASSPTFNRPGTSVECQAHFLLMEGACQTANYFHNKE